MINFSIIIATYNRGKLLKETLNNLNDILQDKLFDNKNEIIVINNNSTDDTEIILKEYSRKYSFIKYNNEYNQGLSYARNRGINEANNEILIFMDDDIVVHTSWIDNILRGFKDLKIAIVGGKVLPYKIKVPPWLPQEYYFLASIFDLGEKRKKTRSIMGCNFAVRKKVLDEVGYFNVNLGRKGKQLLGGEENDLCLRITKKGYEVIYEPNAIIYHKIEDKLNYNYILNNSYWVGVSEARLELIQKKYIRFTLKYIRSLLFRNTLYWIRGKFAQTQEDSIQYSIRRNYSNGYLKFWKKNNQ